jgi:hypothetical protein
MEYQDQVKSHLSTYKKKHFPDMVDGIWKRKNKKGIEKIVTLEYAFSKESTGDKYHNLLSEYRDAFLASKFMLGADRIHLHMHFNHLNSSQAMCINFFYPLIKEGRLELISEYLGFLDETIDYDSAVFEKDSEIDSQEGHRPTNFDFYFKTKSGKQLYFEVKYTENEFGQTKDDVEHRDKFNKVYKEIMEPIEDRFKQPELFFKNYQIIRNLIHVGKDKYVIFLYPAENIKIKEGASKAHYEILRKDYQGYFFDKHWADIFQYVNVRVTDSTLRKHLESFQEKYFVDPLSNET